MNHNDQVSDVETTKILELARTCLGLDGDFVELGCYRGDTSLLLARLLRSAQPTQPASSQPARPAHALWLYDSFEGLPPKSAADQSAAGAAFQAGALQVSKRAVKSRFLRANLPLPRLVKAWFSDLTPADLPARIAFAFLDGDLFDSIRTSLALVAPRMSPGGLVLVHDYQNPALPGVTTAVDAFLRASRPSPSFAQFRSLAILRF